MGMWVGASELQEIGTEKVIETLHRYGIDRASLFVLSNYCYFKPREELYEKLSIKPKRACDRDLLKEFINGARRVGLEVTATIVCMNNPILGEENPSCKQVDFRGIAHDGVLCLNNKDVREFLKTIVFDLASRYEVSEIELDYVRFKRSRRGKYLPMHLIACKYCYCSSCKERAIKSGIEWNLLLKEVRETFNDWSTNPSNFSRMENLYTNSFDFIRFFMERPLLAKWLRFRANSITDFVKEIKNVLEDAGTGVQLSADLFYPSISWMVGQDYRSLGKYLDSAKPMIYTKRMGSWESGYFKEIVKLLSSGYEPRLTTFLSTHMRVEISDNLDTLADEGFPNYVAYLETRKARLLLPSKVKVYTGLYSSRIEGVAMTNPKDIEESSKYAIAAGADGLYFCSFRATPKENFKRIRNVKELLSLRQTT